MNRTTLIWASVAFITIAITIIGLSIYSLIPKEKEYHGFVEFYGVIVREPYQSPITEPPFDNVWIKITIDDTKDGKRHVINTWYKERPYFTLEKGDLVTILVSKDYELLKVRYHKAFGTATLYWEYDTNTLWGIEDHID